MFAVLALLAAAGYGISDFLAGFASRRAPATRVAALTQATALLPALAVAWYVGEASPASAMGWGAVAGLGSAVGSLALFRGLAVGAMSVVAPVSAVVAAAVPVLVGAAGGERLSVPAMVGIALALVAVALVAVEEQAGPAPVHAGGKDARGGGRWWTRRWGSRVLGYGCAGGVGFALLYLGLGAAEGSGGWPVVVSLAVSCVLLAALAGLATGGVLPRPVTMPALAVPVAAGLGAGIAALAFRAATTSGSVAVAAVLASLYPAVTVLLAAAVLREPVSGRRAGGLGLALLAVALISAS